MEDRVVWRRHYRVLGQCGDLPGEILCRAEGGRGPMGGGHMGEGGGVDGVTEDWHEG